MTKRITEQQQDRILLLKEAGLPSRQIAKIVLGSESKKSTVNDFLARKYGEVKVDTPRLEYDPRDVAFTHTRTAKKAPRVLLFDIETAPIRAHIWSIWQQGVGLNQIESDWFILSFCAKWLGEDEVIYFDQRNVADMEDDSELLSKLWYLLNEADIVVGQNCVEVNTPVLKQDLTWVPVGDLKVGDKIVGFDEGRSPFDRCRNAEGVWESKTERGGRQVRSTEVTEHEIQTKPCVEVELSNGDKIITTKDHYWLGRAEKDDNLRWYKSETLREGQRIYKYCNVWEQDKTYESGWLSGFISGEGTLKSSPKSCVQGIDFCQRPGVTWDKALEYSEKVGLPLCGTRTPRTGGLGRGDVQYSGYLGGKWKTIEYIGRLGIDRFREKIDWDNFGSLKGQVEDVFVVSVKDVGDRQVAVMGTSTSTFIAGGYAMHNCKKFDTKKVNARFIMNGFPKPSSFRQIDTMEIAKKQFGFTSNKLEYMTDKLCTTYKKSKHKKFVGHELWSECLKNNIEAWEEMEEYNRLDVLSLEELYNILSSWDNTLPNFDVFVDEVLDMSEWEKDGFVYSNLGKYQRYRNKTTGQQRRSRVNLLSKEKRQSLLANIM